MKEKDKYSLQKKLKIINLEGTREIENHRWMLELEAKKEETGTYISTKYLPQNNYYGGLNVCPQIIWYSSF